MKYGKIVQMESATHRICTTKNKSGEYILREAYPCTHKKTTLVLKQKGKKNIMLTGRQLKTIAEMLVG